jgi:hypothetical protein
VADGETESVELPVLWVGLDEIPVRAVNQFVLQNEAGEYFLVAGVLTPPVILGTPDRVRAQLESLGHVEVQPVARLAMNERRIKELRDLLNRVLGTGDDGRREGGT